MADAVIEIHGLEEIRAMLQKIGPDFRDTLRPAVEEALEIVRSRMTEYPPPPPNSRYQRTGALGASWQSFPNEGGGSDVLGVVRSSGIPYNRYVQSETDQAAVHRGRWQTDEQVAAEKTDAVTAVLNAFLEALLS